MLSHEVWGSTTSQVTLKTVSRTVRLDGNHTTVIGVSCCGASVIPLYRRDAIYTRPSKFPTTGGMGRGFHLEAYRDAMKAGVTLEQGTSGYLQ